jgi:HNH endonuclease
MLARDTDIPISFLRECFDLDATAPSGLRWRTRPVEHFKSRYRSAEGECNNWNVRCAGKIAGTFSKKNGYWMVAMTFAGRVRLVKNHRIIFALVHGRWPVDQLDHENRDRGANQIGNLRESTQAENTQNTSLRSDNKSRVKGVHWDRDRGKWFAAIGVAGRHRALGRFEHFKDAVKARREAEIQHHPFRVVKPLHPLDYMPPLAFVTDVWRIAVDEPRWEVFDYDL